MAFHSVGDSLLDRHSENNDARSRGVSLGIDRRWDDATKWNGAVGGDFIGENGKVGAESHARNGIDSDV